MGFIEVQIKNPRFVPPLVEVCKEVEGLRKYLTDKS